MLKASSWYVSNGKLPTYLPDSINPVEMGSLAKNYVDSIRINFLRSNQFEVEYIEYAHPCLTLENKMIYAVHNPSN